MNNKKMPLILALVLPIVFVIVLALVILVPNMSVKPQHDFVYMVYNQNQAYDYYTYGNTLYKNTYDLKEDKIVLKPLPLINKDNIVENGTPTINEEAPKMYYYDIKNQTSRELSLKDAQQLSLQKGPSSPDGYTISYSNQYDEGIIGLFGSSDKSAYVITKGRGKKELSGITTGNVYYARNEFDIIGWIK